MATCFDNVIAVKNNCTNTTPSSGLYIDDLGIDLDLLNDITTKQYENGEALFQSKISFARTLLVNSIRTNFSDRFKTRSILGGRRVGYIQENLNVVAADAKIRGIEVEMCNNETYVDLYINRLELLLNYTGNLTLNVYDLLQGRIIDTIAVTGIVAGEKKTIYPNKTYKSERQALHLFIGYDASSVSAYKVSIGQNGCTSCGDGGVVQVNPYMTVGSREMDLAATPVDENLSGIGDTAGISFVYSINCNHEDWLCEKSNMLAVPLLYKTGVEIITHALNNYDEISAAQLVHYDKLLERKQELEGQYIMELDSVLKTLTLPNDDKCFLCNQRIKTVIALP